MAFWTRYDPNTNVLSEALLWREIVVENKKDPRGMLPLLKGVKPSVAKPSVISQLSEK
jgi:hypothetical protein